MSADEIVLLAVTRREVEFLRRVCLDSERDGAAAVLRAVLARDVAPHLPVDDVPVAVPAVPRRKR